MDVMAILQGVSMYPIPRAVVEGFAACRGLDISAHLAKPFADRAFLLVLADVYRWLAAAPAVAQGGQSFSLSEEDKRQLLAEARAIYRRYDPARARRCGAPYGYKGESL